MFRYAVSPSVQENFALQGDLTGRVGRAVLPGTPRGVRGSIFPPSGGSVPAAGTAGASHAPEEVPCPPCFPIPRPCWPWRPALGSRVVPARLLLFGVFCAVLPDLDVIGFKLGIRYADLLGHRGFSHSLLFALLMGLFGAALAPWLRCSRPAAFGVGLAAVASHILLDAMTNGGLGRGRAVAFGQGAVFSGLAAHPGLASQFARLFRQAGAGGADLGVALGLAALLGGGRHGLAVASRSDQGPEDAPPLRRLSLRTRRDSDPGFAPVRLAGVIPLLGSIHIAFRCFDQSVGGEGGGAFSRSGPCAEVFLCPRQ